jgi:outer membrane protein OmpA-like peptidoglycan-associated protein
LFVTLVACASPLAAQRAHEIELGGFGSLTRYDHLMGLKWRAGAGARLGLFLTNGLGVELEGGFAQPRTRTPLVFTTTRWLGASVVLNVRAGRNEPYLLGGYTRIDYGGANDAPYNFGDHAVHGAIGDRITIIEGVALRLEGRAIFAPRTDPRFGGTWAGHVVASFGLSMFALGRRTPERSRAPAPAPAAPAPVVPTPVVAAPAAGPPAIKPPNADSGRVATPTLVFGVMRDVGFEAGGSSLTSGSYPALNDIAAALIAHPEVRVEIAAFTDDAGVPGTIVRLTQLRAEVVRGYLAGRGVPSSRMVARGYGSVRPIASNTTPGGRAQNRRVELRRLP